MQGKLILEDGSEFMGNLLGKTDSIALGEVVFNTSMTGYQEVLTDPSYYGQIVVMTYPLQGNYGVNAFDQQSKKVQVKGFIVREVSDFYSHWESHLSLDDYLKENNIVILEGVDTRSITKTIRDKKAMNGAIIKIDDSEKDISEKIKSYENHKPVYQVTVDEPYVIKGQNRVGKKVAVIDFGIKQNILKQLKLRVKEIKIFDAGVKPEMIEAYDPDGLFLSNGPGDPDDLHGILENLKNIVKKYPTFGICLGHQLLSLLFGLQTKKMKFGHRGANHPVIHLPSQKVFISSQNHGYEVVGESQSVEVLYKNVNDSSIEGIQVKDFPIFSVQFHPEASPGPHDTLYLFDEFIKLMEVSK